MDSESASNGLAGLFDSYRPELLRFLSARCGARDEAEDLLQDLWLKLSTQHLGPVANGRAYLYRMANNLVLDQRRARHRAMARDRKWIEQDGFGAIVAEDRQDPGEAADEAIERREEAEMLRQAIDALPEGARRALRLYRIEGRNQSEIAEIMGISRSGVEKHLAVAMKRLRNSLSDCGLFAVAASDNQVFRQPSAAGNRERNETHD